MMSFSLQKNYLDIIDLSEQKLRAECEDTNE